MQQRHERETRIKDIFAYLQICLYLLSWWPDETRLRTPACCLFCSFSVASEALTQRMRETCVKDTRETCVKDMRETCDLFKGCRRRQAACCKAMQLVASSLLHAGCWVHRQRPQCQHTTRIGRDLSASIVGIVGMQHSERLRRKQERQQTRDHACITVNVKHYVRLPHLLLCP